MHFTILKTCITKQIPQSSAETHRQIIVSNFTRRSTKSATLLGGHFLTLKRAIRIFIETQKQQSETNKKKFTKKPQNLQSERSETPSSVAKSTVCIPNGIVFFVSHVVNSSTTALFDAVVLKGQMNLFLVYFPGFIYVCVVRRPDSA